MKALYPYIDSKTRLRTVRHMKKTSGYLKRSSCKPCHIDGKLEVLADGRQHGIVNIRAKGGRRTDGT